MEEVNAIGSFNAILRGVKTLVDGSVKVELEINPEDEKVISNLIKAYLSNKRLISVGMVSVG